VARRVDALRARGVDVRVIAASDYRRGALRRHAGMAVEAARPRRVDGVEAHVLFPAGLLGLVAARLDRVPLLVYAHGSDVQLSAHRTPLHSFLARRVARGAAIVVANSSSTAEHVRWLGAEAEVVPPGVDFTVFAPGSRSSAREALGLPSDARIATYVGGLVDGKGPDIFAEAVSGMPETLGVVVGRGPWGDAIARRWPRIRLIGAVAPGEVPRWMQAADVVAIPSRAEGLGLAAVEALACGVPVVASAVGGLVEVVEDGFNGLLVPPDDPEALRRALASLVGSDALRDLLAANSRASVARHDRLVVDDEMSALWKRLGVQT
jgi:glycosyltransferase involved in cell wall biosynthesis